jgi:hypothetical protein
VDDCRQFRQFRRIHRDQMPDEVVRIYRALLVVLELKLVELVVEN